MKNRICWRLMSMAALLALATHTVCADDWQLQGRVSYDSKGVLIKGIADPDWSRCTLNSLVLPDDTLWVDQGGLAEVELAGGSFLRIADAAKIEVTSLPPGGNMHVWFGSLYVQRLNSSPGAFLVSTPACHVELSSDSCMRVDVEQNGSTTVTLRWGSAMVNANQGEPIRVADAQRVWIDSGLLPSEPVSFDRSERDGFDLWNNQRAEALAIGYKSVPKEVQISAPTVGISDLSSHGEWVYAENHPYWRPTMVRNFVPYRDGCWNYYAGVGHVWVGAYPFCHVTTHYGRWSYFSDYGWVWAYDPAWAPAWCSTAVIGDYFVWTPVDLANKPVIVGQTPSFSVGGVQFGLANSSSMSAAYVTEGWAPVSPCTAAFADAVSSISSSNVGAWNIYPVGADIKQRIPFDTTVVRLRDYNPPRNIRGWNKPESGPLPTEKVVELDTLMSRKNFDTTPPPKTGSRATSMRASGVRVIRLERATAIQPDDSPGLVAMRNPAEIIPDMEALHAPGGRLLKAGKFFSGLRKLVDESEEGPEEPRKPTVDANGNPIFTNETPIERQINMTKPKNQGTQPPAAPKKDEKTKGKPDSKKGEKTSKPQRSGKSPNSVRLPDIMTQAMNTPDTDSVREQIASSKPAAAAAGCEDSFPKPSRLSKDSGLSSRLLADTSVGSDSR